MEAKYKEIPPLTREEERHLLKNKNDPAAHKKLVDAIIKHIHHERMWRRARVVR